MINPNLSDVTQLIAAVDAYDMKWPAAIGRGLALAEALQQPWPRPPKPSRLVDMKPSAAIDYAVAVAQHIQLAPTVGQIINYDLSNQLRDELIDDLRGQVEAILDHLRPTFDTAAAGVERAVLDLGLRESQTADNLIALGNDAVDAYRDLGGHRGNLDAIANIRIRMSTVLGIDPRPDPTAMGAPDYTIAFVDRESGVTTGLHDQFNGRFQWLTLAELTGGRLHLNSPNQAVRPIKRTMNFTPVDPAERLNVHHEYS